MFRAPIQLPPLSILLDDQLTRNASALAKHVGVSVRTLDRYKKAEYAPRAVMLSLFYESQWGYGLLESTAYNGEMRQRNLADCLRRENAALRVRIARLESIGGFESANAPVWRAI